MGVNRYASVDELVDALFVRSDAYPALVIADADGTAGAVHTGAVHAISGKDLARAIRARADRIARSTCACEAVECDGSAACVVEILALAMAGVQSVLVEASAPKKTREERVRAGDADRIWPTAPAGGSARIADAVPSEWGCARLEAASEESETASNSATVLPWLRTTPIERTDHSRILFFTSGTTGAAKAVVLTDASLLASAWNGSSLLPLRADDTVLNMLPISHVYGLVCGVLWGLACGATVALGRGRRHLFSDASLFQPTVIVAVPTLAQALCARDALGDRLRMMLIGAAPCPPRTVEALRARNIEVHCGYGATETSSGVALSLDDDTTALTLTPDANVRIDDQGQIMIRVPSCLMEGYYRSGKRLTRDQWYATGDIGRVDDHGLLHVDGRMGDVVVLPSGAKLSIPAFEKELRAAWHTDDIAVLCERGRIVVVCGMLEHGETPDRLRRSATDVLQRMFPDARVGVHRVVITGQPLPRTTAGDIERWRLQKEAYENGD